MIAFDAVEAEVRAIGLATVGWFHPQPADAVPDESGTLILLGPGGPEMWEAFQAAPEAQDGAPDPLDRWSRRAIGELARQTGAKALFPFGGPPWHPFQRWAARGEGAHPSPVAMQATSARGLWASYRGALIWAARLDLPPRIDANPCLDCPAPCRTACPVDAFGSGRYDVPTCTAHMRAPPGGECHRGCLVRRACPAGAAIALPETQRAFHMAAFLRANG